MNDDQLKNLLKKDNSTPPAKLGEWSSIEAKITESGSSPFWTTNMFRFSAMACSFALVFIIGSKVFTPAPQELTAQMQADVVSYLFEEAEELDSAYAWID